MTKNGKNWPSDPVLYAEFINAQVEGDEKIKEMREPVQKAFDALVAEQQERLQEMRDNAGVPKDAKVVLKGSYWVEEQ